MKYFTLDSDDIKLCIELACDGVNAHLADQDKLDAMHKVMYAVAEAAQSNQMVTSQLSCGQIHQYSISIRCV